MRPGLLLCALSLVSGCGQTRTPDDNSVALPENSPVSGQPRLMFRDGEELRYSLTHNTEYSLTGELAPSPVKMRIAFTATQVHTVADIEGPRARIEVRLEDVEVVGGDAALAGRIAGQTATLRVAPDGLAEARHSEPGKGLGAPATIAYLGVALPGRKLQANDGWEVRLAFPIGRLLGRGVPEEHVIPITLHYTIAPSTDGGPVLRYTGRARFDFEHAAERADGTLNVRGTSVLDPSGSRVVCNEESASVSSTVAMAGATGSVEVTTSSVLRLR